jgi:hypothetical protein
MTIDVPSINLRAAAMLKWKYIFLALSLIALAAGFSDARPAIVFDLGRSLGAILFGSFLIARVLEQESALYDERTRAPELAWKPGNLQEQPLSNRQEVAHDPAHTTANPH